MRKTSRTITAGLGLLLVMALASSWGSVMTREQVIAAGASMADAQLALLHGNYWGRFWIDGVLWAGLADFSRVADRPDYREALRKMGQRGNWELILDEKEPNHADNVCIGQAYLDVYEETKAPLTIRKTQERLDQIADVILHDERDESAAQRRDREWTKGLTWYWCDALFMAAPVHARLSAMTGDPKYREAMHREWERVSQLLYDQEEHLFFRDARQFGKQTRNGKKVFWARGNGWVVGALARVLPYIPEDDPLRSRYVTQLKELTARLASLQRPDGTWSPSLLAPEDFPYSECSSTALNCFAMAWGINHGILEEKTYRPVVEKAWAALLAARRENGLLGYVQGVGAEPGKVYAGQYTWYGTGAFLMAAAQVAALAPLELPPAPALSGAPPKQK